MQKVLRFAPTRPILALVIAVVIQLLFAVLAGIFGDAILIVKLLACGIALAALFGLGKLEGRSLADFGFRNPILPSLGLGLGAGFLLISLVMGLLAIGGAYHVLGFQFSLEFLGWILVLIPASVAEEILYRGILFRMSEEGWGTLPALVFSALIFGFIHANNPGATLFTSLAIALQAGVLLGAVYVFTRNLWVVIGLHFGWNMATSVFGLSISGVRNPGLLHSEIRGSELWTGGAFGPEAGLVTVIVATSAGLAVLFFANQAGQLRAAGTPKKIIKPMPS